MWVNTTGWFLSAHQHPASSPRRNVSPANPLLVGVRRQPPLLSLLQPLAAALGALQGVTWAEPGGALDALRPRGQRAGFGSPQCWHWQSSASASSDLTAGEV